MASIHSCTARTKSSRLKRYFKLAEAVRTETVIGDNRDFGIDRRICANQLDSPSGRWRLRQPASA